MPFLFLTTAEFVIGLTDNEVFGTVLDHHEKYATKISIDCSRSRKVIISQCEVRRTLQIKSPGEALEALTNGYDNGITVYTHAHALKPMLGENVFTPGVTHIEKKDLCVLRMDGSDCLLVEFPEEGHRCLDITFPDSFEEREPTLLIQDRPIRNAFDCVRPKVADKILQYLHFKNLP